MSVIQIITFSAVLLMFAFWLNNYFKLKMRTSESIAAIIGSLILSASSLLVSELKVGGTVLCSIHGWPHFFARREIKDVIDGAIINKWDFIPGGLYLYFFSDFVFYFSIVLLFYSVIKVFFKKAGAKFHISILIIFIFCIFGIQFYSGNIKAIYINNEVKKANYCENNTDCVNLGNKCPFGCYVYVNNSKKERVLALINSFESNCVYGCVFCPGVTCENKKCKPVCEK